MKINQKQVIGWFALIILALIPVFLWFKFGAGMNEFMSYSDIAHSLGEIFGLVGMTMFALTFVLSTRISLIEDIFGGLDKVYIAHGVLGGTALILILFHPIFLVLKFIPVNIGLAATYLLPSSYWAVNFGIIALLGLVGLIYITLYTKIRYHKWKFSHEFLGIVFIFAAFHIFLVRGTVSSDSIFQGYYVYATVVSVIGLSAFSYSLFIKNRLLKNAVYTIESIKIKDSSAEITMIPEHKPINYKSGQFVFLRFYNQNLSREAHPFSLASRSNDDKLKVIVKKLGDFTEEIGKLNVGDKVSVEGPYGRFNFYCSRDKDQVWIAAGIGITPFLGMVEDLETCDLKRKIDLYYTSRGDEFIGKDRLTEIQTDKKGFRFIPWDSNNKGRITVEDIKKLSGELKDKEFFICGPEGFKHNLIKGLTESGVKRNCVYEEAFEFR